MRSWKRWRVEGRQSHGAVRLVGEWKSARETVKAMSPARQGVAQGASVVTRPQAAGGLRVTLATSATAELVAGEDGVAAI
jgi:hypothetical protein